MSQFLPNSISAFDRKNRQPFISCGAGLAEDLETHPKARPSRPHCLPSMPFGGLSGATTLPSLEASRGIPSPGLGEVSALALLVLAAPGWQ